MHKHDSIVVTGCLIAAAALTHPDGAALAR